MTESRGGRTTGAIALAVSIAMLPGVAMASGSSAVRPMITAGPGLSAAMPGAWTQALMAKKKKKKSAKGTLTPEAAEPKRDAIRAAVASDVESESWDAAASETETNAALLGDPISYQEAAEFRYKQAEADRDVDAAKQGIEDAQIALDILHYYDAVASGEASSNWKVIDPSSAGSLIFDTEALIARTEELIEEIESDDDDVGSGAGAGAGKATKERKKRETKPGTVMIAVGSAATLIGAGGLSMVGAGMAISAQKQNEVEEQVLPDDQDEVTRLDREGNQANLIAYIGAGVAVAGLGAGITLIVIGAKRRKEAGNGPSSASLQVVPALSRRFSGLAVRGRF